MRRSMATLAKERGAAFPISRFGRDERGPRPPKRPEPMSVSVRLLGRLVEGLLNLRWMLEVEGMGSDEAKRKLCERYAKGARALANMAGPKALVVPTLVGGEPIAAFDGLYGSFSFSFSERAGLSMSVASMNALARMMWMSKFASSADRAIEVSGQALAEVIVDEPTCAYVLALVDGAAKALSSRGPVTRRRLRVAYREDADFDAYGFSALAGDSMWFLAFGGSWPDSRLATECVASYLVCLKNGDIGDGSGVAALRIHNPVIGLTRSLPVSEIDLESARSILCGMLGYAESEVEPFLATLDAPESYEPPADSDGEAPASDSPNPPKRRRRSRAKKADLDGMSVRERRIELFGDEKPSLSVLLKKCVDVPRGGIVPESAVRVDSFGLPEMGVPESAMGPSALSDCVIRIAALRAGSEPLPQDVAFADALAAAAELDRRGIATSGAGIARGGHLEAARACAESLAKASESPLSRDALRDVAVLRWLAMFNSEKMLAEPMPLRAAGESDAVIGAIDELASRLSDMVRKYGKPTGVRENLVQGDSFGISYARADIVTETSALNVSFSNSAPRPGQLLPAAIRLRLLESHPGSDAVRSAILNPRLGTAHVITRRSVEPSTELGRAIDAILA